MSTPTLIHWVEMKLVGGPKSPRDCDLRDGLSQGACTGVPATGLGRGVDSMDAAGRPVRAAVTFPANDPGHTSDLAMQPTQLSRDSLAFGKVEQSSCRQSIDLHQLKRRRHTDALCAA